MELGLQFLDTNCSNPGKNPKCKRSQFKSANLYDDQVLCNPCHELAQQEESSVSSPKDVHDLLLEETADKASEAQESATQPIQPGTSPVAKRNPPSQATTNITNLEDVISVKSHETEVAQGAPFVQTREDEGKSKRAATSTDGMEESTEQDGTTAYRRAAVSIDHEDEPQHKRQRLEDTLHRTGDTGVSDSYVAGQMNDVFKLLEQAALRFHLDADIKVDTRACVVGLREIKEKLSQAYRSLNLHEICGVAMVQDGIITSYDVLLGLVGSILYQEVFQYPVVAQTFNIPEEILKALKKELLYDGMYATVLCVSPS